MEIVISATWSPGRLSTPWEALCWRLTLYALRRDNFCFRWATSSVIEFIFARNFVNIGLIYACPFPVSNDMGIYGQSATDPVISGDRGGHARQTAGMVTV